MYVKMIRRSSVGDVDSEEDRGEGAAKRLYHNYYKKNAKRKPTLNKGLLTGERFCADLVKLVMHAKVLSKQVASNAVQTGKIYTHLSKPITSTHKFHTRTHTPTDTNN